MMSDKEEFLANEEEILTSWAMISSARLAKECRDWNKEEEEGHYEEGCCYNSSYEW
jgi:hypothetical protein